MTEFVATNPGISVFIVIVIALMFEQAMSVLAAYFNSKNRK